MHSGNRHIQPAFDSVHQLRGQADLRHQDENLPALGDDLSCQGKVYLGLAASCDAGQEIFAKFVQIPPNQFIGMLLFRIKRKGLCPGMRSLGQNLLIRDSPYQAFVDQRLHCGAPASHAGAHVFSIKSFRVLQNQLESLPLFRSPFQELYG